MLTNRQREVLQYLREYQQVRGKPPTVREIQAHIGCRSTNAARKHLAALEQKGCIRRIPGESRNIELVVP